MKSISTMNDLNELVEIIKTTSRGENEKITISDTIFHDTRVLNSYSRPHRTNVPMVGIRFVNCEFISIPFDEMKNCEFVKCEINMINRVDMDGCLFENTNINFISHSYLSNTTFEDSHINHSISFSHIGISKMSKLIIRCGRKDLSSLTCDGNIIFSEISINSGPDIDIDFANSIIANSTIRIYGLDFSSADITDDGGFRKINISKCDIINSSIEPGFFSTDLGKVPTPHISTDIPDCDIIGWKYGLKWNKDWDDIEYLDHLHNLFNHVLIKLLIPKEAKKACGPILRNGYRKYRCSEAKVLAIYHLTGDDYSHIKYDSFKDPDKVKEAVDTMFTKEMPDDFKAVSRWASVNDEMFEYKKGAIVRPKKEFDENPLIECGSGIHFYMSKEIAIQELFYMLQ